MMIDKLKMTRMKAARAQAHTRSRTRINFRAAKGFDGWTVTKGCCHRLGTIKRTESGQYEYSGTTQLAAESSAQIEQFLKDLNSKESK